VFFVNDSDETRHLNLEISPNIWKVSGIALVICLLFVGDGIFSKGINCTLSLSKAPISFPLVLNSHYTFSFNFKFAKPTIFLFQRHATFETKLQITSGRHRQLSKGSPIRPTLKQCLPLNYPSPSMANPKVSCALSDDITASSKLGICLRFEMTIAKI